MKPAKLLISAVILALLPALHLHAQLTSTSWAKCYGGSENDSFAHVFAASDGTYLVSANTASGDGDVHIPPLGSGTWLMKLDSNGSIISQRGLDVTRVTDIVQASNQDFILSTGSEVLRLDNQLNIKWRKVFSSLTLSASIDNGALAGSSNQIFSSGADTIPRLLIKFNADGNEVWTRGFRFSDATYASIRNITLLADGSFLYVGFQSDDFGGRFTVLGKSDNNGKKLWEHEIFFDAAKIVPLQNGNYFVLGDHAAYFVDHAGFLSSTCAFTGTDAIATQDGHIILLNPNNINNRMLLEINYNGDSVQSANYGGTDRERFYNISPAPDGSFLVAGDTRSNDEDVWGNHGKTDIWILKLRDLSTIVRSPLLSSFHIFPTLTSGAVSITFPSKENNTIAVIDLQGRTVNVQKEIINGKGTLDLSGKPAGMYIVRLSSGNAFFQSKVILMR